MDDRRFDDLTRRLAQNVSRRTAMKGGFVALLSAFGLRGDAAAQVTQAYCGNTSCRNNPGKCKPGCACCQLGNGNSRCMPPGSCAGGTTPPPTTPAPTTPPPTTPAPTTPAPTTPPPTTTTTTTTTVQCVNAATCPQPSNACQVATCTNGLCGFANKSDGTTCNEGNACRLNDTCQAGVCTGGSPVICPDVGIPCVTAVCDPAVGCTTTPKEAGTPCADFFKCDGNEVCDGAGNCIEGTPVTCAACSFCDPATGTCIPVEDGVLCNEGNACRPNDTCQGGVCTGGSPLVCPDVGIPCVTAVCDPAIGCTTTPKEAGTPCADFNRCDGTEICDGQGTCVDGPPVVCPSGQVCSDGECICSPASCPSGCCDAAGACQLGTADGVCGTGGGACADCTLGNGTCGGGGQAGVCGCTPEPVATTCAGKCGTVDNNCGASVDCTAECPGCCAGNVCQAGTNVVCGGVEVCFHDIPSDYCFIDGSCVSAGTLNPHNGCQECDPTQDQRQWTPLVGVECATACTLNGTCQIRGGVGGPSTVVCIADEVGVGGCVINGVCYGPQQRRPDEPCQYCDPDRSQTNWSFRNDGFTCSGACRTGGTCFSGACGGGTVSPGFCTIGGVCRRTGETDPSRGPCWVCDPAQNPNDWSTVADGVPCPNACVANATCQAGVCAGDGSVACEQPSDRDICTRAVCDPVTGSCVVRPVPNGHSDIKGCQQCPNCQFGVCIGGGPQPVDCGLCGTCNEAASMCVPAQVGADCGSDCTTSRSCNSAGACVAEPGVCGATNIGCQARSCVGNQCVESGAKDGELCDGDRCRVCQGGLCVPKCGPCQRCDPATGTCTACSSCCGGDCCESGEACCGEGGFDFFCRPQNQTCEGICFDTPRTCCGRDNNGSIKTCDIGASCCRNLLGEFTGCCPSNRTCCFTGECCPPNYVCGLGGCTPTSGP